MKRFLNYAKFNLHRTSFLKNSRSKAKDEKRTGKKYDSFKLNQKEQLHYLGESLTFVNY